MSIYTTTAALKTAMKKVMTATSSPSCVVAILDNRLIVEAGVIDKFCQVFLENGFEKNGRGRIWGSQLTALFSGISGSEACIISTNKRGINLRFDDANINLQLKEPTEESISSIFNKKEEESKVLFDTRSQDFVDLIEGPVQNAAKNDIRYYLNGVSIESEKGLLSATGSCGKKICTATAEISVSEDMTPFILPYETAKAVKDVFDDDQDLSVTQIGSASNMQILFEGRGIRWITSVIDGKFPNWREIIKGASKRSNLVELDKTKLIGAINRVTALSEQDIVSIHIEEKSVLIFSPDKLQRETINLDGVINESKAVMLSSLAKPLKKCIESVPTEKINFSLSGDSEFSVFVLTPSNQWTNYWFGMVTSTCI